MLFFFQRQERSQHVGEFVFVCVCVCVCVCVACGVFLGAGVSSVRAGGLVCVCVYDCEERCLALLSVTVTATIDCWFFSELL